mmetsp:Transcript_3528/g.5364  ORF Transcript_3528/g.5364 Transcript_3528/m.5364 type:complete len:204 (-) Transcript_3528:490-1101(-)
MANLFRSGSSRCCISLLLFAFMVATISAFTPPSSSISSTSTRTQQFQLSAVPSPERLFDYSKKPPTFNKQTTLWEPSHETEDAPYGPWGSFLRGGPSPFLVRVLQPSDYEQAVFKYMAQTSCSRAEAQGNMDAFFNNAADWAYQKSEEARGRPKVDYTQLKLKDAILVITWAVFVTPFLGRCAYLIAATDAGWGITVDDIFNF